MQLGTHGTLVTQPDVAANESPRPYLHPLMDAAGRPVTDFRPADHPWHHALSVAVPIVRVEGNDRPITFWGGPTFVRDHGYHDLRNHGSQVVVSEDGSTLELEWRDERGGVVLREAREHRVVDIDAQTWALGVTSTWRADSTLRFGSPATEGRANAGYGGLFLRAAPRFTGATAMRGDGAVGQSEAMGADGRWCGLVKSGEGTVVMAAAPDSASAGGTVVRALRAGADAVLRAVLPRGMDAGRGGTRELAVVGGVVGERAGRGIHRSHRRLARLNSTGRSLR